MATLASLQGTGGGRIPMGDLSYVISRHDLIQIIDSMPTDTCRQMHIAAQTGDTQTAQRLIREAATAYYAGAPAAPAAPPVAHYTSKELMRKPIRRHPRTRRYCS